MATPKPTTAVPQLDLIYTGPSGQESPVFGLLVVGARYQAPDADLAEYLCRAHPDYWQRPGLPAATKE